MLNWILFLILFGLIAGVLSYIGVLALKSYQGAVSRRQVLMIVGGALLLPLLKVNFIMSVAGLDTTEVMICNGNASQELLVELNGAVGRIGPNETARFRTARFRNRLRYNANRISVDENFGRGYFVVHVGDRSRLEVKELRYRSFRGGGEEDNDEPLFRQVIYNQILKLDDDYNNCIVLSPGQSAPRLANQELMQKRVFSTRRLWR
jgi:hypothetical protein